MKNIVRTPFYVLRTVGDGECWSLALFVSRAAVRLGLLRPILDRVLATPGYGGPGRSFVRDPYLSSRNENGVLFTQSGGLDI